MALLKFSTMATRINKTCVSLMWKVVSCSTGAFSSAVEQKLEKIH